MSWFRRFSTNSKILAGALVVVLVIFGIAYYQYSVYPQKLKKERNSALATVQEALDRKAGDCTQSLSQLEAYLNKNSKDAEAWAAQGICEFESGKYAEAKKSFEQVLVLDPENKSAKNHLKAIGNDPSKYFDFNKAQVDQNDFETLLGGPLSAEVLVFSRALKLPLPDSKILQYVSAEFTSNQNVAQTASYISKYLTDNDYELENSQYGDEAVIDQDTEDIRVITGYKGKTILTISIWKKQPEVHIDYTLMQ